jgi:2-oxoglutarate dehydrogenase E1 component
VANCSTAAQYFHLLRLQAFNLSRHPRPLVLLTPKSLLRHPLATSSLRDLLQGSFQPVIDDQKTREHPERVKRIILCSGKIAIDMLSHESRPQNDETAIVRIELLYPLPEEQIQRVIASYPQAREMIWVQEEPRNMGAWSYIHPKLVDIVDSNLTVDVISRPERSSPATGFFELYSAEQERIVAEAVGAPIKQPGGKHVH